MSVGLQHKCPCCGGYVEFDSDVQKMVCPFCDTEFEVSLFAQTEDESQPDPVFSYENMGTDAQWSADEKTHIHTYRCESCGGELIGDNTTAVTRCPYCSNPVVLLDQLSGVYRPDRVIPFKINKEDAQKALKNFYRKKKLLPSLFCKTNQVESIQGMYVPFWLFDCEVRADLRYDATKVRRYSDSEYDYTETSYYDLIRGGHFNFAQIPVDGSKKMDDTYMEAIEPYDYSEMVSFQTAFLAGYIADKYDVAAEEATPRIENRIVSSVQTSLQPHGFTTCSMSTSSIRKMNEKIHYALLPVWMLNTQYKGKTYTFAMNGQTGKLVGKLPISFLKSIGYFAGIFASVTAIAGTIIYFL